MKRQKRGSRGPKASPLPKGPALVTSVGASLAFALGCGGTQQRPPQGHPPQIDQRQEQTADPSGGDQHFAEPPPQAPPPQAIPPQAPPPPQVAPQVAPPPQVAPQVAPPPPPPPVLPPPPQVQVRPPQHVRPPPQPPPVRPPQPPVQKVPQDVIRPQAPPPVLPSRDDMSTMPPLVEPFDRRK